MSRFLLPCRTGIDPTIAAVVADSIDSQTRVNCRSPIAVEEVRERQAAAPMKKGAIARARLTWRLWHHNLHRARGLNRLNLDGVGRLVELTVTLKSLPSNFLAWRWWSSW